MKDKFAVLGGDRRQISAAEEWKKYGISVSMFGFDTYGGIEESPLDDTLKDASVAVLPIPASHDGKLNMPYSNKDEPLIADIVSRLPDSVTAVCGGMIPQNISEMLESMGIEVIDLCKSERFNTLNAVPTVEGAIELAMTHLPITVSGCRAAVIGCGRIGRLLCRRLYALGAEVTAVSRSEKDLTISEIDGYTPCDLKSFVSTVGKTDVIFNTVPHTVLTDEYLSEIRADTPVIDLASRPGGIDMQSALKYGTKVITALSLPGKVAPVTAGKIIARCLIEHYPGVKT